MKRSGMKRLKISVAAFAAGVAMCFEAMAAVIDLPVTTVHGEQCYYYDVQPKESIYQLTHKLGVSREKIVEYNPSTADGLKPLMRLYFPVSEFKKEAGNRKAVYAAAAGITTHIVKRGETIYGIAKKYAMSPDYLMRLNPQAADGLKTGDELRIVAEDEIDKAAENGDSPSGEGNAVAVAENGRHIIRKGETLYGIANSYGISLDELVEANPSVNPVTYKVGQILHIPGGEEIAGADVDDAGSDDYSSVGYSADASDSVSAEIPEYGFDENADSAEVAEVEPVNVAVMLPFMLGEEAQSRTTQLYTEFFKGMLLAADDMRNDGGAPVNFNFYDTGGSIDTVNSLLLKPEITSADLVVAPDSRDHLEAVMKAVGEETLVLNVFAVKNDDYKQNRNMIQTNIPHDAMYAKAIDAFMEKYRMVQPVFLTCNGGMADKVSFVNALKERLDSEGKEYREIIYTNSLSVEELASIDPDLNPVVFVPCSGSKAEFAKFVQAVTHLRNGAEHKQNVTVFGYPEWITFRGDSFNELCDLDATIYSRFYSSESDRAIRDVKERYKQIYGIEMFEAVPTQGLLGYDMGKYIISGLRHKSETGEMPLVFNGLQSRLNLTRSNSGNADSLSGDSAVAVGGRVNDALVIINYKPGGIVECVKR